MSPTRPQTFFEELLKEKTIVVPGIFFDVDPGHRRDVSIESGISHFLTSHATQLFASPCHHYIRLSFGPPMEDLDRGTSYAQVNRS